MRVGQQAVLVVATPGRAQNNLKVFGAKPLEDVIRNLGAVIMTEMETALANQAPPAPAPDPSRHELPPLVIEGIPTPVEKMTQAQLRAFIPHMLKYSTGRGKPGWGKDTTKPTWWPKGVPWANVRMDARAEDEKQKVSWTHALRQIVTNCYRFHNREDLLPSFSEEEEAAAAAAANGGASSTTNVANSAGNKKAGRQHRALVMAHKSAAQNYQQPQPQQQQQQQHAAQLIASSSINNHNSGHTVVSTLTISINIFVFFLTIFVSLFSDGFRFHILVFIPDFNSNFFAGKSSKCSDYPSNNLQFRRNGFHFTIGSFNRRQSSVDQLQRHDHSTGRWDHHTGYSDGTRTTWGAHPSRSGCRGC